MTVVFNIWWPKVSIISCLFDDFLKYFTTGQFRWMIGSYWPFTKRAIFHYSSQLQTWSQIWFSTSFSDFRQGLAGLRHVFDQLSTFFYRKPGREPISTCRDWCSRFAADSLVRVCARQMTCRKISYHCQPTNLMKLDFRYIFYYSCISWCN